MSYAFFGLLNPLRVIQLLKRGRSSLRPLVSKGQYLCLLKIDIKDDASLFQNPYSMAILGKKCALPTTTNRPCRKRLYLPLTTQLTSK